MKKMVIVESIIEEYVKYPSSDCRNGALIRFKNNNGHQIMQTLCSHHALIIKGDCAPQLSLLAKIYGFETEEL